MICKLTLTYERVSTNKPLIYEMSHRYDIVFNIYQAFVDENAIGHMVLEIEGDSMQVNAAIAFLEAEGLSVDLVNHDYKFQQLLCETCKEALYTKGGRP